MSFPLGIKALTLVAALGAAAIAGALNPLRDTAASYQSVAITLKSGTVIEAGRDEVTHALWMQCVAAKACEHEPRIAPPAGFYPVTDVNALDIGQFIAWFNAETGSAWRLPTRTEAQAFADLLPKEANKKLFTDPRMAWAADYYLRKSWTRPVKTAGTFGTLENGLRDIGGNVWEWTSTCVAKGTGDNACPAYYVNGEHEAEIPVFLRDAISGGCASGVPPTNLGFRLVRSQ